MRPTRRRPSSHCGSGPTPSSTTSARSTPGSWRRSRPEPLSGGGVGGHEGRVGRALDEPDALEREVAEPGASEDEGLVNRTEVARVLAGRSVVAHHEVLVLAHDPRQRAVLAGAGGRRRGAIRIGDDVGLLDPDRTCSRSRDEDPPVLEADRIARHADDPLDERNALRLEAGARRWGEDHHVAVVVAVEAGGQLVDEDVFAIDDRRKHRALLHLKRLRHEVVDDQVDEQCEDERLDDLEGAAEGAARTGALATGGRAVLVALWGDVGHRPWAAGGGPTG